MIPEKTARHVSLRGQGLQSRGVVLSQPTGQASEHHQQYGYQPDDEANQAEASAGGDDISECQKHNTYCCFCSSVRHRGAS